VSIRTAITIHDQVLIDQCEAERRFANVEPYNYLFVGPRPFNVAGPGLPTGSHPVFPARWFQPNFEHLPQFYDFTGWWALTHHVERQNLPDNLICLQYDHQVNSATLMLQLPPILAVNPMVAFVAGHRDAGNFLLHIGGFEDAYRAGLDHIGAPSLDDWPAFNEWPSTQGTAWRTEALVEFMEWVTPLFDFWADNVWAGHLMERMPKAWLVATGQREAYLHGAVTHEGKDSHGTCHLMAGDTTTFHQRNATFGKVV
jgi:hypothetical protein